MKVVKFGGSSLANGEQFQKVINIIRNDPTRKVIVTSAPGKRFKDDIKVTDLLIKYAQSTLKQIDCTEVIDQIWYRYQIIANYFQISQDLLQPLYQELINLPNHSYKDSDFLLAAFKAHGEKINAQLLALILQQQQVPAQFLDPATAGLMVSDNANDARVLSETYHNLSKWRQTPQLLIVPGFYGITKA
ncbi:MAG: aspartate kinase, partial [Bombilactobacillus sp.]